MSMTKLKVTEFDPFVLVPFFGSLRNVRTPALAVAATAAVLGPLLLASAIDGTLGTFSDFQLWPDIERVLGIGHPSPSEPSFPLIRDVTSMFLAIVVIIMYVVATHQWRLMSRCLSTLAENGVLKSKSQIKSPWLAHTLKIGVSPGECDPDEALDLFVSRLMDRSARALSKLAIPTAVFAAIIVLSLVLGESRNVFVALDPIGHPVGARVTWLSQAYKSWWAGLNHLLGVFTYFIEAFIAAYFLIIEITVGFLAVYVVVGLSALVDVDADWLNCDGHYGWKPVSDIFATVYLLLALQGATVSVLLVTLGLQNFPWVGGLVVMLIIVVPAYVIVPYKVFKRTMKRAKDRRLLEMRDLRGQIPAGDITGFQALLTEADRIRTAKIRPSYPGWGRIPAVFVAVILPVILTAAQIWFSVSFGAK